MDLSQGMNRLFHLGASGDLSDLRLLERYVDGQEEAATHAFEALLERHGPMVQSVCRSVLRDPHAAEDAFQATFLVLVQRARTLAREGSLGNWLYGVALRTAKKARVQSARRRARELAAAVREPVAGSGAAESEEWLLALHEEIERLPRAYRSAFVLCYLESMSYESVAVHLGLTTTTVRGRLARARKLIRQRLTRRNLELPEGCLVAPSWAGASGSLPSGTRAAVLCTANTWVMGGGGCPGLALAPSVALAKGVLRSMFLNQLRTACAVILGLGIFTAGLCMLNSRSAKAEPRMGRQPQGRILEAATQAGVVQGTKSTANESKTSVASRLDPELVRRAGGTIVATTPITKDCMVLSYLPDWNHGNVDNIGMGNYDGGYRTLLDWRPIDPSLASASDHRFLLALFARKSSGTQPTGPILAFTLTEDWPERTSWKTLPGYDPEPAASFGFEPGESWKLFDITPVIRAQARSGRRGHGLLLRFMNEDRSVQNSNRAEYSFVSREGESAKLRPVILVVKP
jgi:RNA polymerase sigma factor (sigma-70 family)